MTDREIIGAILGEAAALRNMLSDYSSLTDDRDKTALVIKAEFTFRRILDLCRGAEREKGQTSPK